ARPESSRSLGGSWGAATRCPRSWERRRHPCHGAAPYEHPERREQPPRRSRRTLPGSYGGGGRKRAPRTRQRRSWTPREPAHCLHLLLEDATPQGLGQFPVARPPQGPRVCVREGRRGGSERRGRRARAGGEGVHVRFPG